MNEDTLFAMDLRRHGIVEAKERKLKRYKWAQIRKDEQGPCAKCSGMFLCSICDVAGELNAV